MTWAAPLVLIVLALLLLRGLTSAGFEDESAVEKVQNSQSSSADSRDTTDSSHAADPSGSTELADPARTDSQGPDEAAPTPESGLAQIAERELPAEARSTLTVIRDGGPYPYDEDDRTFQNRERILPQQQRGYYREYTVETPGSPNRGARRIVTGRDGDKYWTSDHYASFRQIREGS